MPKSRCSIRSLAASLHLSPSTVAAALRGSVHFKPETIDRVRAAAAAAGYSRNALVSSLMSEVRRAHVHGFKGVLALVKLVTADAPPVPAEFDRQLVAAAQARARELGFEAERFVVDGLDMPVRRLNTILEARGIRGLLLLPSHTRPDLADLDWSRLTGIYTDYNVPRPAVNVVCTDHFLGMMETLRRLAARGYRRPGLFLSPRRELRLECHWSGAFLAYQQLFADFEKVPLLFVDGLDRQRFKAWFTRYQPDVVLGHAPQAMDLMAECGARIPKAHGFVLLNTVSRDRPCAGIDLQPRLIGRRAVELLSAQVQRGETGIPDGPMISGIAPKWVEGPTVAPPR